MKQPIINEVTARLQASLEFSQKTAKARKTMRKRDVIRAQ